MQSFRLKRSRDFFPEPTTKALVGGADIPVAAHVARGARVPGPRRPHRCLPRAERWRETPRARAVARDGERRGGDAPQARGVVRHRRVSLGRGRRRWWWCGRSTWGRRGERGGWFPRGFARRPRRACALGLRASRRDQVALVRGAGPAQPHALRQPPGRAVFVQQTARVRGGHARRQRPGARPRTGAVLRSRRVGAPRRVRGGGRARGEGAG